MNMRVKTLFVVLMMVLVSGAVLFAEGAHAAEAAGESHHFQWIPFLGKLFNSAILFGGLIYLLRKPILKLLSQKSTDVSSDIIQREKLLDEATQNLQSIKDRLTKIEDEIASMKQAAEKSGIEEQKRIEEAGKKEADRILELTGIEIDNRMEKSIRNLKARIADMTIEHFKKDIGNQLDNQAHEKIIEKNIDICGDIIERK